MLAGHLKLRNDLRRPTMEEVGYRASSFAFDGIAGQQRDTSPGCSRPAPPRAQSRTP